MRKKRKKSRHSIFIWIGLTLLIGLGSYLRLLDNYELILLDLRFKSRPIQKVNPQIAIVEIGNDTLDNLGYWPLPRDYHASLIKVLSDCQVNSIIFDVLFSEPTKKDALLAQIRFAYKKPIVLGEYSPKHSKPMEHWIDRFIDEEVSQYNSANIAYVFSDHERAIKLLLLYLEEQGAIDDSGVESEEKKKLQAMLKA